MTTKDALIFFSNTYKKRYGTSYPIAWGKDMAIMKRLMSTYDDAELKRFIDFYINQLNDSFVTSNGHSLNLFSTSIPKIVAGLKKTAASTNPDFERLEQARRKGANE